MAADTRKSGRVIVLDGDKLGHVAGATVALAVVVVQAFYRESGPLTTVTRAAWTFVGVYTAVFFFSRVILRAMLRQMIEEKRNRREQVLKRRQEARERAAEMGLAPPPGVEESPDQEGEGEQPASSTG